MDMLGQVSPSYYILATVMVMYTALEVWIRAY